MLTDQALADSEPTATATFPTTALTKTMNTATVESGVLETSNGHTGKNRTLSSTSKGSSGAGKAAGIAPGVTLLLTFLSGAFVIMKTLSS